MMIAAKISDSLKRLCDLEQGSPLASALTDSERALAIARLRSIIPESVLARHDLMMRRGKRSIVAVVNDVCSACWLHLPIGQLAELRGARGLNSCVHCGTYIFLKPQPRNEVILQGSPKPRTKSRSPRASEAWPQTRRGTG